MNGGINIDSRLEDWGKLVHRRNQSGWIHGQPRLTGDEFTISEDGVHVPRVGLLSSLDEQGLYTQEEAVNLGILNEQGAQNLLDILGAYDREERSTIVNNILCMREQTYWVSGDGPGGICNRVEEPHFEAFGNCLQPMYGRGLHQATKDSCFNVRRVLDI